MRVQQCVRFAHYVRSLSIILICIRLIQTLYDSHTHICKYKADDRHVYQTNLVSLLGTVLFGTLYICDQIQVKHQFAAYFKIKLSVVCTG